MKFQPNNKYNTIAIYAIGVVLVCILFVVMLTNIHIVLAIIGKIFSVIAPILIGLVIAYILNPVEVFIEDTVLSTIFKKDKASKAFRKTSVIITMILFLAIISALVYFVVPEIVESVSSLITQLPVYGQRITAWARTTLDNNPSFRDMLISQTDNIIGYAENFVGKAGPLITSLASGVVNFVYGILQFLIGCIVAIYLLIDKEKFIAQSKKLIVSITPRNFSYKFFSISHKIDNILIGSVLSKILDSAIIGLICFVGMMIFNMTMETPYPVLIGVIVGVSNIIPFFGPIFGAIPSAFLILADELSTMNGLQVPVRTIAFLIFIIVLQQFDGNILGPKLQGEMTGLSAFWILFAILLGGGLFGFIGMLLAVPVFAIIYMLTNLFVNYKLKSRNMPTETDAYYGRFNLMRSKIYGDLATETDEAVAEKADKKIVKEKEKPKLKK